MWQPAQRHTNMNQSYFVHERDDLQDELVLPQIISVFEDDRVHRLVLSSEDKLGRHQSALTQTHTQSRKDYIKHCRTILLRKKAHFSLPRGSN